MVLSAHGPPVMTTRWTRPRAHSSSSSFVSACCSSPTPPVPSRHVGSSSQRQNTAREHSVAKRSDFMANTGLAIPAQRIAFASMCIRSSGYHVPGSRPGHNQWHVFYERCAASACSLLRWPSVRRHPIVYLVDDALPPLLDQGVVGPRRRHGCALLLQRCEGHGVDGTVLKRRVTGMGG